MGVDIEDLLDLDREAKEKILESVKNTEIPKRAKKYIERYEDIGGERSRFLWRWGWDLLTAREPGFVLSTVSNDMTEEVAQVKIAHPPTAKGRGHAHSVRGGLIC